MKIIIIRIILLCILLFQSTVIYADFTYNSEYYYTSRPQNVGFTTPEHSMFKTYSNNNHNINLYNGVLNVEVLLQHYKDQDFDIPISIQYVSEGFKPSKYPSIVGLNWNLSVGGVITRQVNGTPDDVKGSSERSFYMRRGLLAAIKMGSFSYSGTPEHNFDLSYLKFDGKLLAYDYAPDIFEFKIGSYNGKFIIDCKGDVVSLNNDGYKIDISDMTIQEHKYTEIPEASTITITDPNGYIYIFGGTTTYLEYSIPQKDVPKKISKAPVTIMGWYLKTIKAPNNRTAEFKYTSIKQKNKYKNHSFLRRETLAFGIISSTDTDSHEFYLHDDIYRPNIDQIIIDEIKIKFTRHKWDFPFYSGVSLNDAPLNYLTSVVTTSGSVSNGTYLEYFSKGNYFFLKELYTGFLNIKNEVYKFEYNLPEVLPEPETVKVDHWGFWNGGFQKSVNDITTVRKYLENASNYKAVNSSLCDITLLSKITYPTKGSTEIIYEPNEYMYYQEKNYNKYQFIQKELSDSEFCGGARIKSIKDYDPISKQYINERTFLYQDLDGKSSGVIGLRPKYILDWETSISILACYYNYSTGSSNTYGGVLNKKEYHVGYSHVREVFKNNNEILHEFTSYLDIPDAEETKVKITDDVLEDSSISTWKRRDFYGLYKANDMSKYRGLLLRKTIYSNTKRPLYTEEYKYNIDKAKEKFETIITSTANGYVSNKIFFGIPLLMKKKIVDKEGIEHTETYTYNEYNMLRSEIKKNSQGYLIENTYQYIGDIIDGYQDIINESKGELNYCLNDTWFYDPDQDDVIQNIEYANVCWNEYYARQNDIINEIKKTPEGSLFYDNNNLASLVNQTTKIIKGNEKYIAGSILYLYGKNEHNQIHPIKKLVFESLDKTDADEGLLNRFHKYDERMKHKESYTYNKLGNLTAITSDSEKTVYLWSYKGQYPIAEIKNVTYEEVNKLIDINALSESETPDMIKVNALRNSLPNAMVTTNSYTLLRGMSRSNNPRGFTTYYGYDIFNRLQKSYNLKNGEEKIIKEYMYNFNNK